MTTNSEKNYFPYCGFWRYQNTGAAVLVGAIPEKFSKMKNLWFFLLSDICFHQTK